MVTFDPVTDDQREFLRNALKIPEPPEEDLKIAPQIQEQGYESHNLWITMDVFCVLFMVWAVRVILFFLFFIPIVKYLSKYKSEQEELQE